MADNITTKQIAAWKNDVLTSLNNYNKNVTEPVVTLCGNIKKVLSSKDDKALYTRFNDLEYFAKSIPEAIKEFKSQFDDAIKAFNNAVTKNDTTYEDSITLANQDQLRELGKDIRNLFNK